MTIREFREDAPMVMDVGTFVITRVIADSRAQALAAAKRRMKERGYKVVDVTAVNQTAGDEWLVDLQVVAR